MNWSSGHFWLAALNGPLAQPSHDEADCADMGTAFGLDASLGPARDEPAPAGSHGAAATGATPPWEYRLTRRCGL